MQDLEDIRKQQITDMMDDISRLKNENADLIDRLQAADKDISDLSIGVEILARDNVQYRSELKALREQKPAIDKTKIASCVADTIFSRIKDSRGITTRLQFMGGKWPDDEFSQGGANKESFTEMVEDAIFEFFASNSISVAQSRDSAEPVKAIPRKMTPSSIVPDDYRNSAEGYRAGWNDVLECIQSNPNYHIGKMVGAKQAVPDELPVEVLDAVSEALGDCYDCTRTWSAWGVGTMSQHDFCQVAETSERVDEIARAAITAFLAAPQPEEKMWWREIAETSWSQTTDKAWFEHCQKSPEHDAWLERKGESQPEGAAPEPFVQVLVPDADDVKNEGVSFSLADWEKLDKAPAGTKLYARPIIEVSALREWFESWQRLKGTQDCDLEMAGGAYTFEPIQKQWEFTMHGAQYTQQSPAPKAQSLDRVIELENELIELINHCSVIEEPGSVIDSAYKTLVKDKLTLRNPEPGSFNAIAEGGK